MVAKPALTDEALAAQIQDVFTKDPDVNVRDLRVDVVEGVVRLFGVSAHLDEVRRAEELVAQLVGVRAVENLLAVESPHPPSDAELEASARSAAAAVDRRVEVEVADGAAILRGEVEHPEMVDDVIHAVERVPGIKEIRSEVTFTALTGHEGILRPMLMQTLRECYPIPGAIRVVRLRDGLVTLEGRVSTSEQRDRVLDAVREVPGVHRVESRIHIRPNKPDTYQGRHRSGAER